MTHRLSTKESFKVFLMCSPLMAAVSLGTFYTLDAVLLQPSRERVTKQISSHLPSGITNNGEVYTLTHGDGLANVRVHPSGGSALDFYITRPDFKGEVTYYAISQVSVGGITRDSQLNEDVPEIISLCLDPNPEKLNAALNRIDKVNSLPTLWGIR